MTTPHISLLPANINGGHDFIVSDPHGCLAAFQKVLGTIDQRHNPHDRLFICGDIVDRGPHSFALIQFIKAWNACEHKPKIYAIRGDHEDLTEKALKFLQETQWTPAALESKSGSHLISSRFSKVMRAIYRHESKCKQHPDLAADRKTFYYNLKQRIKDGRYGGAVQEQQGLIDLINSVKNGGAWLLDLPCESQQEALAFIKDLPYIYRIAGKKPFDIVHAAPLSENRLSRGNRYLTPEEKFYCTWARSYAYKSNPTIKQNGRTPQSIPCYGGHTVLAAAAPIYAEINLRNVDTHSTRKKGMILADHTAGTFSFIAADPTAPVPTDVTQAINALQQIEIKYRTLSTTPVAPQENLTAPQKVSTNKQKTATNQTPAHPPSDGMTTASLSTAPISQQPPPVICITQFHDKILLASQQQLDLTQDSDLQQFKKNFHVAIKTQSATLDPQQRRALASHILNCKDHPLAKERHYSAHPLFFSIRAKAYNHETKSMHRIVSLLLNEPDQRRSVRGLLASLTGVPYEFRRYSKYLG